MKRLIAFIFLSFLIPAVCFAEGNFIEALSAQAQNEKYFFGLDRGRHKADFSGSFIPAAGFSEGSFIEALNKRARNAKHFFNPITGQTRAEITIHDQHYQDENGVWQDTVEDFEDSELAGFTHKCDKLRHRLYVANDGRRRWYPRHNVLTEYVEIGQLEYRFAAGEWRVLELGTPLRQGNVLKWKKPDYALTLTNIWHKVKIEARLENSAFAKPLRWPVSLVGLNYSNGKFISRAEGSVVGSVEKPFGWGANASADNPNIPVKSSYSVGYITFTADLSNAVYPVVIDPTLILQPNAAAGLDTFISSVSPNTTRATATQIDAGEFVGWTEVIRTLIKFDLSTLPADAVIDPTQSYIGLTPTADYSNNARTIRGYRQNRAWTEAGATWNKYDGVTSWQTAGGFGADDCEQTAVFTRDFTASETLNVEKAFYFASGVTTKALMDLGNGWLIKADTESEDAYVFASSDHATASYRPRLVVNCLTNTQFNGVKMQGVRVN